ncbi:hypothetical protein [Sulfurimonas sp. C5]|uniref:hypothetical protein n=1 Tax=Sulfurimonas sp. C5 TaxID=3036947 RepID=UPI002458E808|nr:hypothetical protein [Sulfurimonas sp. C5]MDH4944806.1 hypothetical protein [Sulfurimonas sp. C5]
MIKSLLILLILLFSACSTEPAPNSWEYKSSSYFESYKKNFLSDNDILAEADLESAVSYAKQGTDVTQLASIYLGTCALNIAVGVEDSCKEYQDIEELVTCPKIKNYYKMIQKDFDNLDTEMLPARYRAFVIAMQQKNTEQANSIVQKMKDPISQLLEISLLVDAVTIETLQQAITSSSFHGYKKGSIFLLNKLEMKTNDLKEKELIRKKIELLK